MRNPEPRMRMPDGFNEGWIEFGQGGDRAIKGRTNASDVISDLIAAAEENLEPARERKSA